MLKEQDIICVGLLNWTSDYTKSTMELLTEMASGNRVLFINYACSYKDVWQHLRKKKRIPLAQVLGFADRLVRHQLTEGREVFVLIPPPMLPINQLNSGWLYSTLLRWNTSRMLKSIRKVMQRLDIQSPIVMNALHPIVGNELAGKLSEKALIYYCYDAIEAETWSRQHGKTAELTFMQRVDAVVTTSKGLYASKRRVQPSCYLVENGVNINLFKQANVFRGDRQSKTIGYIGSIDNRLDIDLLERCFQQFPDVRFLFVGRVPDPAIVHRLGRYANVLQAGAQPPSSIPQFVKQMDIGLIPFCLNEQTSAIYPLKINEYLAAGLPVVSTDFTDLRSFEPMVSVCNTADAFIQAIEYALHETDPTLPMQRLAMAQENSWENRGWQFAKVLEQVLQQKDAPAPSTAVPNYTA